MMELLPPVGWGDVARRSDLDGLERRFDGLERRMDNLELALRGQTRFLATTLIAAMVAMTGIFGLIVHL